MSILSSTDEPRRPRLPSAAPPHPREDERLAAVCEFAGCARADDPLLNEVARRAALACGVPYGLVTLVREFDQIYLGRCGVAGESTHRDEAICAHTILEDEPFVVEDLRSDRRFADLPIATHPPFIRFYAGAPTFDADGMPLGSVCVLDTEPREFDSRRLFTLQRYARIAGAALEARRLALDLLNTPPQGVSAESALARLDAAIGALIDSATGLPKCP